MKLTLEEEAPTNKLERLCKQQFWVEGTEWCHGHLNLYSRLPIKAFWPWNRQSGYKVGEIRFRNNTGISPALDVKLWGITQKDAETFLNKLEAEMGRSVEAILHVKPIEVTALEQNLLSP